MYKLKQPSTKYMTKNDAQEDANIHRNNHEVKTLRKLTDNKGQRPIKIP